MHDLGQRTKFLHLWRIPEKASLKVWGRSREGRVARRLASTESSSRVIEVESVPVVGNEMVLGDSMGDAWSGSELWFSDVGI